jgi:RNA polymerase sigma-70 factor (ECF subfamily)
LIASIRRFAKNGSKRFGDGDRPMGFKDDHETSWTLLQRLHGKDEDAWRRFMDEYYPRIRARARRLLGNEADAQELASEVLTELVQHLPRFAYDPGRSFRSWLQTVIRRTYVDWQRRKRARPKLVAAHVDAEFTAPAAEELAPAIAEKTNRVWQAAQGVRQEVGEQRWSAFWAYMTRQGVTAAQVGKEFAMTAARVRVDAGRILEKLRHRLGVACVPEGGPP